MSVSFQTRAGTLLAKGRAGLWRMAVSGVSYPSVFRRTVIEIVLTRHLVRPQELGNPGRPQLSCPVRLVIGWPVRPLSSPHVGPQQMPQQESLCTVGRWSRSVLDVHQPQRRFLSAPQRQLLKGTIAAGRLPLRSAARSYRRGTSWGYGYAPAYSGGYSVEMRINPYEDNQHPFSVGCSRGGRRTRTTLTANKLVHDRPVDAGPAGMSGMQQAGYLRLLRHRCDDYGRMTTTPSLLTKTPYPKPHPTLALSLSCPS